MKASLITSVLAFLAISTSVQAAPQAGGNPPQAAPSQAAGGAQSNQTGPVYITNPTEGTVWQPGSQQTVSWQNPQQGLTALTIELLQGDPNALKLVQTLATNVNPSSGSTQVTVPKNVSIGDYALAVGQDPSQMAYMGGLKIANTGGAASSSSSGAAQQQTAGPSAQSAGVKRQELAAGASGSGAAAGAASPTGSGAAAGASGAASSAGASGAAAGESGAASPTGAAGAAGAASSSGSATAAAQSGAASSAAAGGSSSSSTGSTAGSASGDSGSSSTGSTGGTSGSSSTSSSGSGKLATGAFALAAPLVLTLAF